MRPSADSAGKYGDRARRRDVSLTAELAVENEGVPADGVVPRASFLDLLVVRLSEEYDVDPQVIRRLGLAGLASFAGAPVQAFVPILVEKRLRAMLRRGRASGGPLVSPGASEAVAG
jgi:hypothetical protein